MQFEQIRKMQNDHKRIFVCLNPSFVQILINPDYNYKDYILEGIGLNHHQVS